jgi:hypothetical protein
MLEEESVEETLVWRCKWRQVFWDWEWCYRRKEKSIRIYQTTRCNIPEGSHRLNLRKWTKKMRKNC